MSDRAIHDGSNACNFGNQVHRLTVTITGFGWAERRRVKWRSQSAVAQNIQTPVHRLVRRYTESGIGDRRNNRRARHRTANLSWEQAFRAQEPTISVAPRISKSGRRSGTNGKCHELACAEIVLARHQGMICDHIATTETRAPET